MLQMAPGVTKITVQGWSPCRPRRAVTCNNMDNLILDQPGGLCQLTTVMPGVQF